MKRVENKVEWKTDSGRTLLKFDPNTPKLETPVCEIKRDEIGDFCQALQEAFQMMAPTKVGEQNGE